LGGVDYRFMPMRCTYNTINGEWSGEWAQCGYDVTNITLNSIQVIGPALRSQNYPTINQLSVLEGLTKVEGGAGISAVVGTDTFQATVDTAVLISSGSSYAVPLSSDLSDGQKILLHNGTEQDITITTDISDTIGGEISQLLYPGNTMAIVVDKTNNNFVFV